MILFPYICWLNLLFFHSVIQLIKTRSGYSEISVFLQTKDQRRITNLLPGFGNHLAFLSDLHILLQVAERLMTIAYESGVNLFDTAEVYAAGK